MSVEPTTLERSALERKDREELTTIAQALGAKPSSRARKAEIVQLILELTGVEAAGPGAGDGPTEEATVDDDTDTTDTTDTGSPDVAGDAPAADASPPAAPAPAAEGDAPDAG